MKSTSVSSNCTRSPSRLKLMAQVRMLSERLVPHITEGTRVRLRAEVKSMRVEQKVLSEKVVSLAEENAKLKASLAEALATPKVS